MTQGDVRISHVSYDRAHTSAEDVHAYFPLARLNAAAAAGRIGSLARGSTASPRTGATG